jgi:2-polyprenyl-3-methyl-5-hydroxy-6-metoxy-1,4-benzoquinol methylase
MRATRSPRPGAATLTETEIRPDHLRAAQHERFIRDVARLKRRHREFVHVVCPACGEDDGRSGLRKYGLTYQFCGYCETMYVNPRPTPAILEWYYATSENYAYWNSHIFPQSEDARRAKIFRPRARRLVALCKALRVRTHTLLEVGAGYGTFCEEAKKLRLFKKVIAVEPTPSLAETCRLKGIDVVAKPIEQARFTRGTVDVVAAFEVIEHLFSPREFVRACAAVVAPGGLLVLSCPNVKGFDVMQLKERSDTVDVEHLNYFHPVSLRRLVAESGFDVLQILTPGLLDAELVRKKALAGEYSLKRSQFLRRVLIEDWDRLGASFQQFLAENNLSSHMWLVARKPRRGRFRSEGTV